MTITFLVLAFIGYLSFRVFQEKKKKNIKNYNHIEERKCKNFKLKKMILIR